MHLVLWGAKQGREGFHHYPEWSTTEKRWTSHFRDFHLIFSYCGLPQVTEAAEREPMGGGAAMLNSWGSSEECIK